MTLARADQEKNTRSVAEHDMKVAEYVNAYTSGEYIRFRHMLKEVHELCHEILKCNKAGMKEEWGDVVHFFQLWLFWRFKMNGEIWHCTRHSVEKFMSRHAYWKKIYAHVGLPETISNFCGNHTKCEKVIKHLAKFGVSAEKAAASFATVVKNHYEQKDKG